MSNFFAWLANTLLTSHGRHTHMCPLPSAASDFKTKHALTNPPSHQCTSYMWYSEPIHDPNCLLAF